MKKALLVFSLFFAIVSIGNAQSKKNPSKVTEVSVSAPTKFIEVSGVILEIYDREGQQDGLELAITADILEGKDPRDPEITLIHFPELSERAYRFSESLQEANQDADGYKVIKMKYSEFLKNMRTKYN